MCTSPPCDLGIDFPADADAHVAAVWPFFGQFVAHEVLHAGEQLGPIGGRLVGEVLLGIIDSDPESFRSVDTAWQPTLPGRREGSFGLADILVPPRRFAT